MQPDSGKGIWHRITSDAEFKRKWDKIFNKKKDKDKNGKR
jgi:hypothetical protein